MFTLSTSVSSSSSVLLFHARLNNIQKVAMDIASTITCNKVAIDEATKTNDINTIGTLFLLNSKLEIKLAKSEKLVKRIQEKLVKLECNKLPLSTDSKDKWVSEGFQNEYNTMLAVYKACKSLVELKACNSGILSKADIENFVDAYRHQVTNCNFLKNCNYIKNNKLVVYNKSCYAWAKGLSSEEEKEKSTILKMVDENYKECLEFILEFIQ